MLQEFGYRFFSALCFTFLPALRGERRARCSQTQRYFLVNLNCFILFRPLKSGSVIFIYDIFVNMFRYFFYSEMPTSSQALILQVTNDSALPPIHPRRQCWEDEADDSKRQAPFDLKHEVFDRKFTNNASSDQQFQASTQIHLVQLKTSDVQRQGQIKEKLKKKPQVRPFGGLPVLECRVDFSSLPQLLKIRGLHGSLGFNKNDNTVHWRVNSIGPFYERVNLTPSRVIYNQAKARLNQQNPFNTSYLVDTPRFTYVHADRQRPFAREEGYGDLMDPETLYARYKRAKNRELNDQTDFRQEAQTYFKLVYYGTDSITGQFKYRLRVCDPQEPGSFRLTSANTNDDGDFIVQPPPGVHVSGSEIRLSRAAPNESCFVLLQEDENRPGEFKPVENTSRYAPSMADMRSEISDINYPISARRTWDVHIPVQDSTYSKHSFQTYKSSNYFENNADEYRTDITSTENRYRSLNNDLNVAEAKVTKTANMAEIYGGIQSSVSPQSWAESPSSFSGRPSPIGRYGVPLKPHHATEANEDYMTNLSHESPDVYNKLLSLGFRRAKDSRRQGDVVTKQDTGQTGTAVSNSGLDTHSFDKWSRTTDAPSALLANQGANNLSTIVSPRKSAGPGFSSTEWKADNLRLLNRTAENTAPFGFGPGYLNSENM